MQQYMSQDDFSHYEGDGEDGAEEVAGDGEGHCEGFCEEVGLGGCDVGHCCWMEAWACVLCCVVSGIGGRGGQVDR